ncbi:hypothetical protein F4677DRAFT_448457 [Hypoxylon crocopeplum]|nr:hypothetical protein F4677DRAFT_448457 [Hypoxylon crocopeplum]
MFESATGVINTEAWLQNLGRVHRVQHGLANRKLFPETSKLSLEEIEDIIKIKKTNLVKLDLKISKVKKERKANESPS